MGDEYLVHILGRLSSIQLNPVYSGQIWCFPGQFQFFTGFPGVIWIETQNLQPLGCTIHSGLLIQMREVLQGVSGGALWVVR